MQISRRKLFGGSAALAVAAVAGARVSSYDPFANVEAGTGGQTYTFRAVDLGAGSPRLFIAGESFDLSAVDLRPGAINWVRPAYEGGELVLYPAEQNFNRPGRFT